MQEVTVSIPEPDMLGVKFRQDGRIGFAEVNKALRDSALKSVFQWHFSVWIECEHCDNSGIASEDEKLLLSEFEQFLSRLALGSDPDKPNALFMARIDWNRSRELIWRVYDPEIVDRPLREILGTELPPREFDYRIDLDAGWILAEWHLQV